MDWRLPYPSRREPVLADAVVATSQPLAVSAGLQAMRDGGNAVDAAIAAAATLTVVEPTSNGIGSDLFAIVWDGAALHALNASGRSPAGLDPEPLLARGEIPLHGWDAVTVPGAVSGWTALQERFGRLGLDRLVAPAAAYAAEGYPVGPVTAAAWARSAAVFGGHEDFRPFLPSGRAPRAGERFAFPDQARTLTEIGATGGSSFYGGPLAERIAAHAAANGHCLTAEDLAGHTVEWVETLAQPFGDIVLHELPPNGQGLAALQALGICERLDLADADPDAADTIHLLIEAMKLAFADAQAHIADPAAMTIDPRRLLEPEYLDACAARIDPTAAGAPAPGDLQQGGTVYLCTADPSGMMVSLIQSNFHGFGSGVVVPGTGISLQNRGAGFTTTRDHPNVVAPSKRPFHTIIPAFVTTADGSPAMAYGVMGGHMQPQGHLQVALRTALWGSNPQAALDAPRWRVESGRQVALEEGVGDRVRRDLAARGHEILDDTSMGGFGGGQAIARCGDAWLGASDPRKEGQAAGF